VNDQLIAGRYELAERLGVGGMSTVRLARDRRLERSVAVKLLAEHLADDASFVSRFRREALAAARLVHPNIVQVFDFGLDQDSGAQYIVMEYVKGNSGAELLREQGRLPLAEALAIVGHACRGLEFAHRHGVVHRDIKPGNLLRSEEGTTKVADFGIAKNLADESSITQVGSVLGTASYLAPEQAAGQEAGPAADLYGLGVVAYQLLSGQLPYEAQSLTELAIKQQREAPPLLDEIVDGVTPQLAMAVDRALALDPNDRFADADAMRKALMDGARGTGDVATSATRVAGAAGAGGPATGATRRLQQEPATTRQPTSRTAVPGVVQRQPSPPRQPVAPPPPVTPAPVATGASRRQRARRIVAVVIAVLLIALGVTIAVVATSTGPTAVRLRAITSHQTQDIVRELKSLVNDNTK
jgi:eukaryotic-like serine/threonine-protein kinase